MPQSLNLTDYIKVYKALTPELCQKILKVTETTTWRPHYWHNAYGGVNLNDNRKREDLAETNERFTQGIEVVT